jgi:two-component sensor histidine kinase
MDGRGFTLDGDDIKLGPVTAVAGGKVSVTWRMFRPDRLHIEWREIGGPPVSPPQRRGFGSRLIEQALASDLNGNAQLYFPREGVRCCMDIPVNHISVR